jgi:two-component system chemotaxis response regulator CheB
MTINAAGVRRDVIVIGASTGGFAAIQDIVALLPKGLAAVVGVVLHRGPFKSEFAQLLGRRSPMAVVEPTARGPLVPGTIYVAPADRHMRFTNGAVLVDRGPKEHHTRPAVDPLFTTAADAFGRRVMGVVLSGNGSDGLLGCLAIKESGGLVIAQSPEEAACTSMPVSALEYDHVDALLPVGDIAPVLVRLAAGEEVEVPDRRRRATSIQTGAR